MKKITDSLTVNKYYKMSNLELEQEAAKFKIGEYVENVGITRTSRRRIIEQLLTKDLANNSRFAAFISILALLISIISIIISVT